MFDADKVLEVLGLDAATIEAIGDVNSYNPFSTEITDNGTVDQKAAAVAFEQVASQIFTTVNAIAVAIDAAAGDDVTAAEIFTLAIEQVAEKIEEQADVIEAIEVQAASLQAEADALQVTVDELQNVVDLGGDAAVQAAIDLSETQQLQTEKVDAVTAKNNEKAAETVDLTDSTIIETIVTNTITEVDNESNSTTVADNFANSSITSTIAQAVSNVNKQIDEIDSLDITAFKISALATLEIGAETLAEQVKETVEKEVLTKEVEELDVIINSGSATVEEIAAAESSKSDKLTEIDAKIEITLAADTLVTVNEDSSSSASTFEVAGTTATSAVDANGFYGNLSHVDGSNWVYTPHVSGDHGQALNDLQSYYETFVITDVDNTTHNVTVLFYGSNDAAVITAADPSAITEGDSATDVTATGDASHADADADNIDDLFISVPTGAISTNAYGTYEVSTAGVWTYTLDSTNATIEALDASSASITDTIIITAEDGTEETVTITINGSNDAAVITAADASVAEGNTTTGSTSSTSYDVANAFQLSDAQVVWNDYDPDATGDKDIATNTNQH